jgi:hypothetical protein
MLEMVTMVGGVSAALIAVISSVFMNIRHSRCTSIDCCGVHCKRDVMTLDDMDKDTKMHTNQISNITV